MNQYAENRQEVLYQLMCGYVFQIKLEQADQDERRWIEKLKNEQIEHKKGTKVPKKTQKEAERQRKEQKESN